MEKIMKVLVINCGSSSLKYQLLDMTDEKLLAVGLVDRIGIDRSMLTHEKIGNEFKYKLGVPMKDHKEAIGHVLNTLKDKEQGVIKSMSEISAVGHRVVHAGEKYSESVIIDDAVIKTLEECVELAPLHNPPNLLGIAACKELMPNTPMVAVFDTAFHQTMHQDAFMYALPYKYYEQYGVRKYGFHGTSHKYVSQVAAEMLGMPLSKTKIITCHLGNGGSVTAIKGGECIDTSMGFTPLEGIIMGTRSGDIDSAILGYIQQKENLETSEVVDILNKQSGLLGISGVSSDMRDLREAFEQGNPRAQLALKMFSRKVKFYIGAYFALLNGADAIVFTAGIGENDIEMRQEICAGLYNLGIKLDEEHNDRRGEAYEISSADSKVKLFLIPTNEELMIARETTSLVS
jgi:acetate kinase